MICFPNAKINFGLRVVEKRPDGYHNLETVFYPIGLKDALEIVQHPDGEAYSIDVDGHQSKGLDENTNTVTKAFRLLRRDFKLQPMSVYLRKAIPSGAGLGGGSSDGANALKIISQLNNLKLTDDDLARYSAQIGADCAFFIKNNPIFAKGIGTEFEPIDLNLAGYYLVLVKPDVHVSTAEAYSLVKPAYPEYSLKSLVTLPAEEWEKRIVNDFEFSVFERYPMIREIKDKLYREGAVYASMSGSGSSVYALFKNPIDLSLAFPGCFYWSEMLQN
jgi:4-diphosphocytidyl-2-C-methyl-D-erythritol kinase